MPTERFAPYSATNIRYMSRAKRPGLAADIVRDGQVVAHIVIPDDEPGVEHDFTTVAASYYFDRHLASLPATFFDETLMDDDTVRACFLIDLVDATLDESMDDVRRRWVSPKHRGRM
ncbi:hypothetical protein [Rhodanobacter denitrificans]|uniref:hypothetical protein n=1 Tax=Rhodanobacter denitrificans TaxID=666685 RepID=UPI001F335FBE|nr:hypothetical protein [Rhodanobacter denitrificans]UJJ60650.1 hypothetical protein LRK55_19650 [Rhodanobacter denitrificans]